MKSKNKIFSSFAFKINIGWLYPDLMSTYGDRGNIIVLSKRCEALGIETEVKRIGIEEDPKELNNCDFLFMGGAQDRQQEIVNKDLLENKGKYLKKAIENNIPGLFICGAYQFLGKYYKAADGTKIEGLSIFDIHTINPGLNSKRLIGDIIVRINNFKLMFDGVKKQKEVHKSILVGFENHGGRTYLGKNVKPFAEVLRGFGNNGEDKTEGITYKNTIGTYLHGPILSKNWELVDLLIEKTIYNKYEKQIDLKESNHVLEDEAKKVIVRRYI